MKAEVAERLSILAIRINAMLNDSVAYVRDTCTEEEFVNYRKEAGKVMGEILINIAEKIYKEHPSLRPEYLRGTYKLNKEIFEPRFYVGKPL